MGETIKLTTKSGITIDAYKATPAGTPRGGMVVVQEIFGVNPHIRSVADFYAAQGYLAIAPALFDSVKPHVELTYQPADMQAGMALAKEVKPEDALGAVEAAAAAASSAGKVGVVGYCWGGTLAYLAAAKLPVAAAVGYYGGGIAGMLDEKPKAPLQLHFGEKDAHIPMSDVDKVKAAVPDVPLYVYPAEHGFNCDARGSYDKPSADLAAERTLAFFASHIK